MCLYLLFLKAQFNSAVVIEFFFFSLCCRVGLFNGGACKGKEWKKLLVQWLTLLKLMKNPRSSRFSQFVNDVLQNRLAPN